MDPGKLTIKQLLLGMRASQFWGVLCVVVGLLIGSFTLGFKTSNALHDSASEAFTKCEEAKTKLQDKARFFSAYLSYELNKDKGDPEEIEERRNAFRDLVLHYIDARELVLHKTSEGLAAVTFEEGLPWVLPYELHSVMAD